MSNIQTVKTELEELFEDTSLKEFEKRMKFHKLLSVNPNKNKIKAHPYMKNVKYLPISHVQSLMDMFFFCQWGMRNFQTQVISNEVVGTMEVYYIDPITGKEHTRTGTAAIQIMVDKVPDNIKNSPQERNRWAIDGSNKKANALEMGYPKLDAMCFKNACAKIGKIFGRDLNRSMDQVAQSSVNMFENSEKISNIIKPENNE
jgi:hypothetical protein